MLGDGEIDFYPDGSPVTYDSSGTVDFSTPSSSNYLPVSAPQSTAAAVTSAPTNWGSILTPIASAVSSIYTQNQITQRQQTAISAGQVPGGAVPGALIAKNAAGQSTIFGIPLLYVVGGVAAFMLMK